VQHPDDQRPVGVVLGLLGGQLALVDEALDERVVVRELAELAGTQQVRPGVADVHETEAPLLVENPRGQRRAHAVEAWVVLDPGEDLPVRRRGRLTELRQRVGEARAVKLSDRVDRDRAGQFARDGASHAVGDRQQVRAGVPGVLVAIADKTDVGACGVAECQRHRYFLSSRTVLPTRTWVPIPTGVGPWTRDSPTKVPFVDPRSSTYHRSACGRSMA